MDSTLPRAARLTTGSGVATFLVDPETGQSVVYSSVVAGTPGVAAADILFDVELIGAQSVLAQITGTFVATVAFEQTLDGTSWFGVLGLPVSAKASGITSATAVGAWCFPAIGKRMRARVSAFTSGSVASNVCLSNVPAAALENGATTVANVTLDAQTSGGGVTPAKVRTAASTNLTLLGTGTRRLYGWRLFNASASPRYLKFYNKASAPVVATDVPVFTIVLAPGIVADFDTTLGINFSTGLAYAITGAIADTDATNTVVDDVVGLILWK